MTAQFDRNNFKMINNSVKILFKRRSCLCFYDLSVVSNRKEKDWALSLKYRLIKTLEEWVDDSQRAFPKVV